IDALEKVIERNKEHIEPGKNVEDVYRINKAGKIAALIGIESGNMIEESIDNLVKLHERGAKYMPLTWNYNLSWATAAAIEDEKPDEEQKGLSEKIGRASCRE